MNTKFYTIMMGDKFLPSNIMKDYTDNIVECIKFTHREDAEEHFRWLRKDMDFKIVEVECRIRID